jgi:hypothetical protein
VEEELAITPDNVCMVKSFHTFEEKKAKPN